MSHKRVIPKFLIHAYKDLYALCLMFLSDAQTYRKEIKKNRMVEVQQILNSDYFNADYYKKLVGKNLSDISLAIHYLYVGYRDGLNPSKEFSAELYSRLYPRLRHEDVNPLWHYEAYGKKDGTIPLGVEDAKKIMIDESEIITIRQKKSVSKTVLLLSHEMSLTGAPRALLNLAIALKNNGIYCVYSSLLPGPMMKESKQKGIDYKILPLNYMEENSEYESDVMAYMASFDMILFNTIATLPHIEKIKSLNVRKVCWIHEGFYAFEYYPNKSQLISLSKLFDKIFVVGEYANSVASQYLCPDVNMENLVYGIDDIANGHRLIQMSTNDDRIVMVLAGSIEERKGQMVLLNSLDYVESKIRKQLNIVLVGKILDKNIADSLKDCKYSCLRILDVVPHDQLMSLFMNMDILLCPSLDDPMPITCTEAMMLSKPVIVSSNTGTASFVSNGSSGYIVKAGDAKSLAKTITEVVRNKDRLKDMGKNARTIYENYFTSSAFEYQVKQLLIPMI